MRRRASDPQDSDFRNDRVSFPRALNGSAKWIAALVGLVLLFLGGFGGLSIAGWSRTNENARDVAVLSEKIEQTDRRLEEHYQAVLKALDEIKQDLRDNR